MMPRSRKMGPKDDFSSSGWADGRGAAAQFNQPAGSKEREGLKERDDVYRADCYCFTKKRRR